MGFWNDFEVVEDCYWAWRNSQWHCLPEPGGVLDQPTLLMKDLNTYHWWYGMAENIVAKEKEVLDKKRR